MAQNIFKGLGVALITPFNTDGSVDYQSLKRLVEFQIDNGADFLCILATTGEAPCLTQEEKDKITELVKDVNKGRIKILKYCGGNNTAAVVEFRGEYEPARKIHHSFTELYSLLFVDGNPAGVKALLNDMGFIENELRLPLVPTRIATKQKMSDILKTLNI